MMSSGLKLQCIRNCHILKIIIIYALVYHSQGLKISKCKNVCTECLRWGLGNCELVGNAHCVKTLNCATEYMGIVIIFKSPLGSKDHGSYYYYHLVVVVVSTRQCFHKANVCGVFQDFMYFEHKKNNNNYYSH